MATAPGHAAPRDSDIAGLLHAGSHDRAIELVLDRYEAKVYRLCCALLRDPVRAQDAAQESLVRIWKALPRYDGRASLSTWIYAITRNRCLTDLARHRRTESLSEPEVEAEVAAMVGQTGSPEGGMKLLRQLVDALPDQFRAPLTLYYYEERSVMEVAAMLAMREGAVKTALFRARAALMEKLRRLGLDSAGLWLEEIAQ